MVPIQLSNQPRFDLRSKLSNDYYSHINRSYRYCSPDTLEISTAIMPVLPSLKRALSTCAKKPQPKQTPPKKSGFEVATEILLEEKEANLQAQKDAEQRRRQRNSNARREYYGVAVSPRYGWESPHASSSSRDTHFAQPPSRNREEARQLWNELYAKRQENDSLKLERQHLVQQLHDYQIGIYHHKQALAESKKEAEDCYQTLNLLNDVLGQNARFDEKIWIERIQLKHRIRVLEIQKKKMVGNLEHYHQMVQAFDEVFSREFVEKERLVRDIERLSKEKCVVCKGRGCSRFKERSESWQESSNNERLEGAHTAVDDHGKKNPLESGSKEEASRPPSRSSYSRKLRAMPSSQRIQFEANEQPNRWCMSQLYGWPCVICSLML